MLMALRTVLAISLCTGIMGQCFSQNTPADSATVYTDSVDMAIAPALFVEGGVLWLSHAYWHYKAGDDPNWSNPELSHSGWQAVKPDFSFDKYPPDWKGIGWFRLVLDLDTLAQAQHLGLVLRHFGASELYWDGRIMAVRGVPDGQSFKETSYITRGEVIPLEITRPGRHVLAVRYSFSGAQEWAPLAMNSFPGFELGLVPIEQELRRQQNSQKLIKGVQLFSGGVCLALAVVFLLIHRVTPTFVVYQLFGLSVAFLGIDFALLIPHELTTSLPTLIVTQKLMQAGTIGYNLSLLASLYVWCRGKIGKSFWWLLGLGVVVWLLMLQPTEWALAIWDVYQGLLTAMGVVLVAEVYIRRRPCAPRSTLLAIGVAAHAIAHVVWFTFVTTDLLGWLSDQSLSLRFLLSSGGNLVLPIMLAAHLAQDIGIQARSLKRRLQEVQDLSALNLAQEQEKQRIIEQQNLLLEERVRERTDALNHQNFALERALTDLHTAQDQLIVSEKMAALGQLVASIAHELNTPISAIATAGRNSSRMLPGLLAELPARLRTLHGNELVAFQTLLNHAATQRTVLTTREERSLRREWQVALTPLLVGTENHGKLDLDETAQRMALLRVQPPVDPYLPLLEHPDATSLLNMTLNLVQLLQNNDLVQQSADKTASIVRALKSYAHTGPGEEEPESVSLADTLDNVLVLYENLLKRNVRLERHYGPLPMIPVYADQLDQVWGNLIHNGLLALQSVPESDRCLTIRTYAEGTWAVVEIEDSGPGIPPQVLPRIFEPFFTTRPKGQGSGLGLDIARKIIVKHGGSISVDSRPGRTLFQVRLPLEGPPLPDLPDLEADPALKAVAADKPLELRPSELRRAEDTRR